MKKKVKVSNKQKMYNERRRNKRALLKHMRSMNRQLLNSTKPGGLVHLGDFATPKNPTLWARFTTWLWMTAGGFALMLSLLIGGMIALVTWGPTWVKWVLRG